MHIVVAGIGAEHSHARLDHEGPLVFTLPDVLSAAECEAMILRIEHLSPAAAPVTTHRGFVMRPDIRNNSRVMFDDEELAEQLMARIRPWLPARLFGRRPIAVNERFRGYRYEPGERFAAHYDGSFRRSDREESALTFMVYLNQDFTGGATTFEEHLVGIVPRTGGALLFQHHLLHTGCVVESGVKYVLRSDVMYAA